MNSKYYLGWNRIFPLDHQNPKFQWIQTIERDLVERSAGAIILGNSTKFLVNYLYVTGSNLDHYEGHFIITSLLDNYYLFDLSVT